MSWAKLLASNRVIQQPSAKAELDSLRSIVARCFSDVTAKGLSTDARFIMAYDAARTLSVMIVRAAGYRPGTSKGDTLGFGAGDNRNTAPSRLRISTAPSRSASSNTVAKF